MDKAKLLHLRKLLVQLNNKAVEINSLLLEEFLEEIDCGSGYKIPRPNLPNVEGKNKSECDSCE